MSTLFSLPGTFNSIVGSELNFRALSLRTVDCVDVNVNGMLVLVAMDEPQSLITP